MSASSSTSVSAMRFSVEGTLFHENGNVVNKQHVHIYDENGVYLGRGKTKKDGRFYVQIRTPAQIDQKITLVFRLCREKEPVREHAVLGQDEALCRKFSFYRGRTEVAESVETFVLDKLKKDLSEVHLDIPYKEEKVPLSYTFDLATAALSAKATGFLAKAKEALDFFDTHGIDDVMDAFDVTPTELTAENTWKLITNGICPIYLKEEGEFYVAEVDWSRYEFDKLESLADVKVYFKKNGDSDPIMDRIEVRFRETLEPSSHSENYTPVQTYRPDQPNFQEGLRIANCAFHVLGQTAFHLGIGHVYGAHAATAAFDYLVGHPLGNLLLPHCQFIRKISLDLGPSAIFGEEEAVLNVSALSVKGIADLISDTNAALDPFSFEPRSPINDGHAFARAQNHHFKILQAAVKGYFDKHWDEMKADWKPVHGFFHRMFKRSPEYRPWGGVEPKEGHWRDASEIGGKEDTFPPRMKYRSSDEGVRSFRYVAGDVNGPLPGDREKIEQFVVDYIHHVTLWHSWIHRSQYVNTERSPSVADVNFAPLSLSSFGKKEYGGISMKDAIRQLEIIGVFHKFDVEDYALVKGKDVDPGVVNGVIAGEQGYLDVGIDPRKEIQESTVI